MLIKIVLLVVFVYLYCVAYRECKQGDERARFWMGFDVAMAGTLLVDIIALAVGSK